MFYFSVYRLNLHLQRICLRQSGVILGHYFLWTISSHAFSITNNCTILSWNWGDGNEPCCVLLKSPDQNGSCQHTEMWCAFKKSCSSRASLTLLRHENLFFYMQSLCFSMWGSVYIYKYTGYDMGATSVMAMNY